MGIGVGVAGAGTLDRRALELSLSVNLGKLLNLSEPVSLPIK